MFILFADTLHDNMGDGVCDRCNNPCPNDIQVNGLCAQCSKLDTSYGPAKVCANDKCAVALRPAYKGRYCETCDKARQAKWVTQEALELKLKEANDRAAKHQEAMLEDFRNSFFAQTKDFFNQLKQNEGVPDGKATSGTARAEDNRATHQAENLQQNSGLVLDEEQEEELDYEETRSMYGMDHGHFDFPGEPAVTPSDSVSNVGSLHSVRSKNSVTPSCVKAVSDRAEMINRIGSILNPDQPQEKEDGEGDSMKQMYGDTKAYESQMKKGGVALSSLQKSVLDKYLFPKNPESVAAFSPVENRSVPIEENDFQYFRTPQANRELLDYISIVRQRNEGADKAATLTPQQIYKNNPRLRACEHELFRIDQAARAGLRFAVYGQWLGTAIKMLLRNELGEDHRLLSEGSDLDKMLGEMFLSTHVTSKQFCTVAALSACQRRRMILDEMQLQPHVLKSCQELPLDKSGAFLFGDLGKEGEESRNLEYIISHYCDKVSSVRKFGSAFKPSPSKPQAKVAQKRPAPSSQGSSGQKRPKFDNPRQGNPKTFGQKQNPGFAGNSSFRQPSGVPPRFRGQQNFKSNKPNQGRFGYN